MIVTMVYEAGGHKCNGCGNVVEDFKGHSEASEMVACEECYEEVMENKPWSVDVVHKVKKLNQPEEGSGSDGD